jgi:hypothetical protein
MEHVNMEEPKNLMLELQNEEFPRVRNAFDNISKALITRVHKKVSEAIRLAVIHEFKYLAYRVTWELDSAAFGMRAKLEFKMLNEESSLLEICDMDIIDVKGKKHYEFKV